VYILKFIVIYSKDYRMDEVDASSSKKKKAITITLICVFILLATLLVIAITLKKKVFILLFCIYVIAYSTFMFALFIIYRKKHTGDFKYEVATYISLFNMIFVLTLFFLGLFIIYRKKNSSQSNTSYNWPQRNY